MNILAAWPIIQEKLKIYMKISFFKIKFIVIIYCCTYFWHNSTFFCLVVSASICYKICLKKMSANKVHYYFKHHKDTAQTDALTRLHICMHNTDNLTPLLSRLCDHSCRLPTVTSVYLMHPSTVCAYIGQNTITISQLLNFWWIFEWMWHIVALVC